MAELVLAPTNTGTEGSGTATGFIVGTTTTLWIDGSDSTYIESTASRSSKGTYPLWSTVDGTIDPSWVYAIGVRFRARTISSDPTSYFVVQLFGQVSKLLSNPFYGSVAPLVPSVDTWSDYDYVIADTEYDTSGWAPLGVQSALTQTFLYARTVPVDSTGEFTASGEIQTSEQRIVLYYTIPATVQPPLRQYPRRDGLGASGVVSHYPPPRSIQASNRRAGGYL